MHNDLYGQNVLITDERKIYLIDWESVEDLTGETSSSFADCLLRIGCPHTCFRNIEQYPLSSFCKRLRECSQVSFEEVNRDWYTRKLFMRGITKGQMTDEEKAKHPRTLFVEE